MIISATSMYGIMAGRMLKLRLEEMSYIRKLILLMRSQISHLNVPLNEMFSNLSNSVRSPYNLIFKNLSKEIEEGYNNSFDGSFSEIWKRNILRERKDLRLDKEEIKEFMQLGESLGQGDTKVVIGVLNMYDEKLVKDIESLSGSMKEKIKIYSSLGILGGIFAVIILI